MKKSIYRGWRNLPYDVQEQDVGIPATRADTAARTTAVAVHLRRANPVTTLLPRTTNWLQQLPAEVRPRLLSSQFARIANELCVRWQDRDDCLLYFDQLLEDRRGDREGFPVGVLRELQVLRRYHETLGTPGGRADSWAEAR